MVKYTGWSFRSRPFSLAQFNNSALGKTMSYSTYLGHYARLYKSPKLRKSL